jgi:murein DD-endopeptidase MepM/ murein hydrolase activator NlpD
VKACALLGLPVAALLVLIGGVVVVLAPAGSGSLAAASASTCAVALPHAVIGLDLDHQQRQVASTIIAVGRGLGVPARGWVVALAAGMQESGLRPLPYGDRDSLGVFQQRTAWGTVTQRMQPKSAARMFFTGGHAGQRGLLDVAGWQQLPVTVAAQAVQVSAYPDAYAKWEPLAVKLVAALGHADAGCAPSGGWVFPLGHTHGVLTAGFGSCGSLWSHCHTGQDFAVPTGTPVQAAGEGVVVFAGWGGAYGNLVEILHPGGVATWYAHLSHLRTHRGTHVRAGQLIGLSGATGNTTGPHLHFEVRLYATTTSSGTPIDPLGWLHAHHLL